LAGGGLRLAMKPGLREWCSIHSIPGGEVDGGGSDLLLEGQECVAWLLVGGIKERWS